MRVADLGVASASTTDTLLAQTISRRATISAANRLPRWNRALEAPVVPWPGFRVRRHAAAVGRDMAAMSSRDRSAWGSGRAQTMPSLNPAASAPSAKLRRPRVVLEGDQVRELDDLGVFEVLAQAGGELVGDLDGVVEPRR